MHEPCMIPEPCMSQAGTWGVIQVGTMHVTCMNYCLIFHACCMHGIWWISCMKHACFKPYSMRGTGVFHVWYGHIPCMVQAYSMRGTGVFHAWYRRGTGIPMHAPCTVQVAAPYNKHTYRFCTRHTILVKSKGKYTLLIHALTVTGKWTELVGRIGCKDRQLLHTY